MLKCFFYLVRKYVYKISVTAGQLIVFVPINCQHAILIYRVIFS